MLAGCFSPLADVESSCADAEKLKKIKFVKPGGVASTAEGPSSEVEVPVRNRLDLRRFLSPFAFSSKIIDRAICVLHTCSVLAVPPYCSFFLHG